MTRWSIRRPVNFKVLGYGFVPTYQKGEKGKYQLVASDKSRKNLKQKLEIVTRKTTPMSFDERIQKLKEITRGWLNYFRMANLHGKLKDMDGWLRNRLRYCIWHHWRADREEMFRWNILGRSQVEGRGTETEEPDPSGDRSGTCLQWSRSRMAGWAIAQSVRGFPPDLWSSGFPLDYAQYFIVLSRLAICQYPSMFPFVICFPHFLMNKCCHKFQPVF